LTRDLIRCARLLAAALLLSLAACQAEEPVPAVPHQVPRGYTATLQMMVDGRQLSFGPFVGYYFRPPDPADLSRLAFVCFNERRFYTLDLPDGALLYEGEAVRVNLPAAGTLPELSKERIQPVFGPAIPASWLATRPQPADEFVHFHSCYDAAGPVRTGYWLRHEAVAAFTYDMGGRVGPDSVLYHPVKPGADRDFAPIVEFDAGPATPY
jgi:hypothetical protein